MLSSTSAHSRSASCTVLSLMKNHVALRFGLTSNCCLSIRGSTTSSPNYCTLIPSSAYLHAISECLLWSFENKLIDSFHSCTNAVDDLAYMMRDHRLAHLAYLTVGPFYGYSPGLCVAKLRHILMAVVDRCRSVKVLMLDLSKADKTDLRWPEDRERDIFEISWLLHYLGSLEVLIVASNREYFRTLNMRDIEPINKESAVHRFFQQIFLPPPSKNQTKQSEDTIWKSRPHTLIMTPGRDHELDKRKEQEQFNTWIRWDRPGWRACDYKKSRRRSSWDM